MIPSVGQKLLFSRMRERKMAYVMTKRRDSQYSPPVASAIVAGERPQYSSDLVCQVVWLRDDVKDSSGELHHAEGVLESLMRRARVDEVSKRQLMDVAQALKRAGIQDSAFVAVQTDEHVNRVADFVNVLRHADRAAPVPANAR